MITLYRHKDDKQSAKIEERLQDLVLAYRVELLENHQKAPFIEEGGKTVQGDEELEKWFRELESELNWQRSISGDGCYIDPKSGKVC